MVRGCFTVSRNTTSPQVRNAGPAFPRGSSDSARFLRPLLNHSISPSPFFRAYLHFTSYSASLFLHSRSFDAHPFILVALSDLIPVYAVFLTFSSFARTQLYEPSRLRRFTAQISSTLLSWYFNPLLVGRPQEFMSRQCDRAVHVVVAFSESWKAREAKGCWKRPNAVK